jgi:Ctr copper transporter family
MLLLLISLAFAADTEDCIEHSSKHKCAEYQMPDGTSINSTELLCKQMPFMPGCSLVNECKSLPSKPYCQPFSILGSICKDMSSMSACKSYSSLCSPDSVVKQCKSQPPMTLLLPGHDYKTLVKSICSEMNMDGCEECIGKPCNSFQIYNKLCTSMPGMSQCDAFLNLCARHKDLSFCSQSLENDLGPVMKMYFHFGYQDYILFKFWIPNSLFTFMLSCIFCILMGIGYEYLLYQNVVMEQKWAAIKEDDAPDSPSSEPLLVRRIAKPSNKIKVFRALMRMVTVTGAYACMLVVMSYNVGLVLSIVLGLGIGAFIWGDIIDLAGLEKEHCC